VYGRSVRWQRLFADLEAQFDAAERRDLDVEVADRTRHELGQVGLQDRLRAAAGERIEARVCGVGAIRGVVQATGAGWVLLGAPGPVEWLVPMTSLLTVAGLGRAASPAVAARSVEGRLGLRHMLRAIARDRAAVHLTLTDGWTWSGTLERVGADHFDVTGSPDDVARPGGPAGVVTVTFSGFAALRRASAR
jgi:hypothetical protein